MLKPFRSFAVFVANAVSGDMLLLLASALALGLANSRFAPFYFSALTSEHGGIGVQPAINDGLIAVFFLLVGLEIKREWVDGALSTWRSRTLPLFGALGGMAVPSLIYLAVNRHDPALWRGWAIPSATDIAFALGCVAVLGSRVPASLRVFLTALAILDDLGAVAIIAGFYTAAIHLLPLCLGLLVMLALWLLNRRNITALWPYLTGFVLLWACFLHSGLHPTLAGVFTAAFVPLRSSGHSPLQRLEHGLAPLVSLLILPLFGFANAGITLSGSGLVSGAALGAGLGLFAGKQLGVFASVFAAIRLGAAHMPTGANWRQLYGVAMLCGIGFTMSLFITHLAFDDQEQVADLAKAGVLIGSALSGIGGMLLLARRA